MIGENGGSGINNGIIKLDIKCFLFLSIHLFGDEESKNWYTNGVVSMQQMKCMKSNNNKK